MYPKYEEKSSREKASWGVSMALGTSICGMALLVNNVQASSGAISISADLVFIAALFGVPSFALGAGVAYLASEIHKDGKKKKKKKKDKSWHEEHDSLSLPRRAREERAARRAKKDKER